MLRVRSVRQATEVTSRCRVPGKCLDAVCSMLLIERRIVLLLVPRGSQVLGAGTIQHIASSRPTLQNVATSPLEGVGVVVNRADVTRLDAAMIHARLTELANRRSTLHLSAKVRRPLAHLRGTANVLSTAKTPNGPAADASSAEAAAAHVPTTDAPSTGAAATHAATACMASSAATTTHAASACMASSAATTAASASATTAATAG